MHASRGNLVREQRKRRPARTPAGRPPPRRALLRRPCGDCWRGQRACFRRVAWPPQTVCRDTGASTRSIALQPARPVRLLGATLGRSAMRQRTPRPSEHGSPSWSLACGMRGSGARRRGAGAITGTDFSRHSLVCARCACRVRRLSLRWFSRGRAGARRTHRQGAPECRGETAEA